MFAVSKRGRSLAISKHIFLLHYSAYVFMLKKERRILRTGITDGRPSKKVWIGSNFPGGVSWEWHRGREIGQAGQKTPWQSQSFRGIGCISLNNFIPKCPHPISRGQEASGRMRGLGRHHFHSKIGLSHTQQKLHCIRTFVQSSIRRCLGLLLRVS